jgi:hypothetical protein
MKKLYLILASTLVLLGTNAQASSGVSKNVLEKKLEEGRFNILKNFDSGTLGPILSKLKDPSGKYIKSPSTKLEMKAKELSLKISLFSSKCKGEAMKTESCMTNFREIQKAQADWDNFALSPEAKESLGETRERRSNNPVGPPRPNLRGSFGKEQGLK